MGNSITGVIKFHMVDITKGIVVEKYLSLKEVHSFEEVSEILVTEHQQENSQQKILSKYYVTNLKSYFQSCWKATY